MTSNELEIFKQSILDDVRVMMQTTGQVTQYIGARYVPLFADPIDWDDQKEYEPLTIVTDKGNSYTSRQFVPKGTPITNDQFWALTANFNAQIEQYRQEVAKFDARITAAQNAADSKAPINHATDSTEYGVGNAANYGHVKLADDAPMVNGANDGVAATPKMIKKAFDTAEFYGVEALAFGDSITRGYGLTNPATQAWPAVACSALGATLHNYAVDGASFSSGGIETQIERANKDGGFVNSNIKLILIGAGINDHGKSASSIQTAINTCTKKIKQYFPNAKIFALPCLCASKPLDAIDQGDGQYLHSYATMSVINALSEIPYVTTYSRAYTWLQSVSGAATDNVHPNQKGAAIIACNFIAHMNRGIQDNKLFFADIPYADNLTTAKGATAYVMSDGISWRAEGRLKLTNVDNLKISDDIIHLPNFCAGRKNNARIVELRSSAYGTLLGYVIDGELKFWNIDQASEEINKKMHANIDYYWEISGICGM